MALGIGASTAIQAIMARFADASILVDTGVMVSKAEEVSKCIYNMEKSFQEIQNTVSKIGGYWIGEASQHHQKMFYDERDDVAKILSRLKEHPQDLKLMATGYAQTEKELTESNRQLKSSYI